MGGAAFAGGAPQTGCDPQYMDAIEARGSLELKRQHVRDQNFIFKADSVLEYTCFANEVTALAGEFTNTGRTGATSGTPTQTYINSNFSHAYLGGHMTAAPPAGGAGSCAVMAAVWQAAHCIDFFERPAQDGWFDFQWYASNDPRTLPQACTTNPINAGTIAIAFNGKQGSYVPATENPNDATQYLVDDINAHTDVFGTDCDTSPMIPTGVIVNRPGFSPATYNEKFCAYPGCYYLPNSMDNGECKNSP
jgi:hypothetical protein